MDLKSKTREQLTTDINILIRQQHGKGSTFCKDRAKVINQMQTELCSRPHKVTILKLPFNKA